MKKAFIFGLLLSICLIYPAFSQSSETLTFTTYYPSPIGVYSELRAQRLAVGDNYYDAAEYCWSGTCTNTIDADADLVVEGNVGIGTASPNPNPSPANNQSSGNLDVNDVFVRSTNSWLSEGGSANTILCNQDGFSSLGGNVAAKFTAADCGGTLPDANYVGVARKVNSCGGVIAFWALDFNEIAPVTGVVGPGVTWYTTGGKPACSWNGISYQVHAIYFRR